MNIKDGSYEFYILECRNMAEVGDVWFKVSLHRDQLWRIPGMLNKDLEFNHPVKEFTSHGDCFKDFGVYGTYNIATAKSLLILLKRHNGFRCFRIRKINLRQESSIVETV